MMSITRFCPILLATTIALAGCGGGGGGGVASIPPPPVAPTPTPPPTQSAAFALIKSATTDQQFPVAGASYAGTATQTPMLGAADQLQVRYVASSNTYEVQLPNTQAWIGLTSRSENEASGGGITVGRQYANDYGSVFRWWVNGSVQGVEAAGIATAASAIPVSGSATYTAFALGSTSESGSGLIVDRSVLGSMTLNFDFAAGTLSGRLMPTLDPEWHDYELDTLNFRDTVYSVGKTTFSGKFDTSLPGVNSFEGLFTGSAAQGVIGNFAFPYRSPLDGKTYQAGGAFSGTK